MSELQEALLSAEARGKRGGGARALGGRGGARVFSKLARRTVEDKLFLAKCTHMYMYTSV